MHLIAISQISKYDIDLLGTQQLQIEETQNDSDPLIYLDLPMCKIGVVASKGASRDFNYQVPVKGIIEKKTIIIQRIMHDYDNEGMFLMIVHFY